MSWPASPNAVCRGRRILPAVQRLVAGYGAAAPAGSLGAIAILPGFPAHEILPWTESSSPNRRLRRERRDRRRTRIACNRQLYHWRGSDAKSRSSRVPLGGGQRRPGGESRSIWWRPRPAMVGLKTGRKAGTGPALLLVPCGGTGSGGLLRPAAASGRAGCRPAVPGDALMNRALLGHFGCTSGVVGSTIAGPRFPESEPSFAANSL